MEIRAFFLCERIVRRMDNSVDVLHFGINNINLTTDSTPVQLSLGLVCRLWFSSAEFGTHTVAIRLMDVDGQTISEAETTVEVPRGKGAMDWHHMAPFKLPVSESGEYAIVLVVDSREEARWPLHVWLDVEDADQEDRS